MQPLCKLGPGGDYTRTCLLVDPVDDDAKSSTFTHSFSYPPHVEAEARLAALHARLRRRWCVAGLVASLAGFGVVSLLVTIPGPAWLGVGVLVSGAFVLLYPGE